TRAEDFDRQTAIVAPYGFVHLMNALVPDFSVAIFPEVMPIVMDVEARLLSIGVDHVWMIGRRALPESPVEVLGDGPWFAVANGAAVAVFVNVTARLDDGADKAIMHQFHVTDQSYIGAVLGAVLHNATIFFRRSDNLLAFVNAVGHRFFDIDVFA